MEQRTIERIKNYEQNLGMAKKNKFRGAIIYIRSATQTLKEGSIDLRFDIDKAKEMVNKAIRNRSVGDEIKWRANWRELNWLKDGR